MRSTMNTIKKYKLSLSSNPKILLAIELLILIILGIIFYLTYQPVSFSCSSDVLYTKTQSNELTPGNYFDFSYTDTTGIVSETFSLPKGIYYFTVDYTCSENVKSGIYYENTRDLIHYLYEGSLNSSQTSFTSRIYNPDSSSFYFLVRFTGDASDGNYANITSISLTSSPLTWIRELFVVFCIFVLFDLGIFLITTYRKIHSKTGQVILLGLLLTVFTICTPLFHKGLVDGVDLSFHLMRIEGIYEAFKGGMFPVKVQPGWLNDYGYPVSIFYGDILLYFPALLRLIGFSLEESFKWFIAFLNVATVLTCYVSFRKIFNNHAAAFMGTVLYSSNILRLEVYRAPQIGTASAMIFYPLIVLGLYQLFFTETTDKEYKRTWLYLLLGYTGILQTHILSCLMFALLTVICVVIYVKRICNKASLWELGKTLLSGLLLNAGFLLPFLDYYFSDNKLNITNHTDYSNVDPISYLAKYQRSGWSFSTLFTDSGIGFSLTIILLCGILLYPFLKEKLEKGHRLFLLLSGVTLLLSSSLLPCGKIARISTGILSYCRTLQYADRFLGPAILFLSAFACALLLSAPVRKEIIYFVGVTLCCLTLYHTLDFLGQLDSFVSYHDSCDLPVNCTGNGEYIPLGTDISQLTGELTYLPDSLQVDNWNKKYLSVTLSLRNLTETEQTITIPLLYYKGYQSTDISDEQKLQTICGDNNCVTIQIPAGYTGTVLVAFHQPWYWIVSEIISAISALLLILYFIPSLYNHKQTC